MILMEIILIVLYMINSKVAFLFSLFFFSLYGFQKNKSTYEKIITLLILSSPLFSLSILGENLHHMFSWIYIFLFIYILYLIRDLIREKYNLSKGFLFILIMLMIMFIQCIIANHTLSNLIEFLQIIIMILPISLTYYAKDYIRQNLSEKFLMQAKNMIGNVIFATAISVIVEYILYTKIGIAIGNISFHAQRTVFDAVFSGYSILSIFLGIGLVIFAYDILSLKKINNIYKLITIAIAIFCNSSRTGLVVATVAIGLGILKNSFSQKGMNLKNFMFLIAFSIMALFILEKLFISRGDTSLFSGSGRIEGYQYAWSLIKSNARSFFFGNGLSSQNYTHMLPHNFILQTWMSSGIFILTLSILLFYKIIKSLKDEVFKSIVICTILGAMLTTDFYANTFFTVFTIVGILYQIGGDNNEKGIDNSNSSSL